TACYGERAPVTRGIPTENARNGKNPERSKRDSPERCDIPRSQAALFRPSLDFHKRFYRQAIWGNDCGCINGLATINAHVLFKSNKRAKVREISHG
ncbi:hypothetical protein, partial [Xanthomonas hortorum]